MNAVLDKAIVAISKLAEAEQEAIARPILARIEVDSRRDGLSADPRSEALLKRLVGEAHEEIGRGEAFDIDPADWRTPLRSGHGPWEGRPSCLKGLDAVLDVPEWGFRAPLADLYRGTSLVASPRS